MTLADILNTSTLPPSKADLKNEVLRLRSVATAACARLTEEYERMPTGTAQSSAGVRNEREWWKQAGREAAFSDVLDLIRAGAK
jgi:hypothetical protein